MKHGTPRLASHNYITKSVNSCWYRISVPGHQ